MDLNTEGLLTIDVALTHWPNITLEISDHFYVIAWFVTIFFLIILFNLVIITSGIIGYGICFWIKKRKAEKNPPVELKEVPEEIN